MTQCREAVAVPSFRVPADRPGSAAFTLIELSIVLVIIGLIVGGVLVGQNLIAAAAVRKIVTDVEKFKTAAYAFRDKYSCMPGDCANATTFFGVASAGCQTPATNTGYVVAPGGTGTCNGEGHYYIGSYGNWQGDEDLSWGGGRTAQDPFQKVLFFHHLGLAGMIQGTYTGTFSTSTSSSTGFVAGVDIPLTGRGAESFPNYEVAGVGDGGIQWTGCIGGTNQNITLWWTVQAAAGDYFTVGLPSSSGTVCPFLTPAEAAALDTKYDDGKALSGTIIVPNSYPGHTKCLQASGAWQMSDTTPSCHLMFSFYQ